MSSVRVRRRLWSVLGALSIGLGAAVVIQPVAGADPDDFSMTSTTMGFGAVFVGESGTEELVITNTSDTVLTPQVSGGLFAGDPDFTSSEDCTSGPLDPDESCSYTYAFSPTATGPHIGDTVLSLEGVTYNVSLTGTGTAPIEVSSATLDHGVVAVGDTETRQVTVTNVSTIVRTPIVTGGLLEDNPHFTVTEDCSGGPLGPAESCAFSYAYTPAAAGTHTAGTVLVIDGVNHIVSLGGTAVPSTTPTATVGNDAPSPRALQPPSRSASRTTPATRWSSRSATASTGTATAPSTSWTARRRRTRYPRS